MSAQIHSKKVKNPQVNDLRSQSMPTRGLSQVRRPAGRLIMMVKPAHAYKTERSYVLADPEAAAGSGQPPDGNGQRGEP
jgi:hypothetical protein